MRHGQELPGNGYVERRLDYFRLSKHGCNYHMSDNGRNYTLCNCAKSWEVKNRCVTSFGRKFYAKHPRNLSSRKSWWEIRMNITHPQYHHKDSWDDV